MNRRIFLQVIVFASAAFFGRYPAMAFRKAKTPALKKTTLSPTLLKEARDIGRDLVQGNRLFFARLDRFMAEIPNNDPMGPLFLIFKESIRQTNEDKRYFLDKLKKHNEIQEAMAVYLKDMDHTAMKTTGCTPPRAIANTYKLEKSIKNVELKIKRLPKQFRTTRYIQSLSQSLARDRKIIRKARKIYKNISLKRTR